MTSPIPVEFCCTICQTTIQSIWVSSLCGRFDSLFNVCPLPIRQTEIKIHIPARISTLTVRITWPHILAPTHNIGTERGRTKKHGDQTENIIQATSVRSLFSLRSLLSTARKPQGKMGKDRDKLAYVWVSPSNQLYSPPNNGRLYLEREREIRFRLLNSKIRYCCLCRTNFRTDKKVQRAGSVGTKIKKYPAIGNEASFKEAQNQIFVDRLKAPGLSWKKSEMQF